MSWEIIRKIELHARVYEEMGEKVPPYRLTYQENMELNRYLKNNNLLPKEACIDCLIKSCMGVFIETVVLIK